jgi:hypothetical protein
MPGISSKVPVGVHNTQREVLGEIGGGGRGVRNVRLAYIALAPIEFGNSSLQPFSLNLCAQTMCKVQQGLGRFFFRWHRPSTDLNAQLRRRNGSSCSRQSPAWGKRVRVKKTRVPLSRSLSLPPPPPPHFSFSPHVSSLINLVLNARMVR